MQRLTSTMLALGLAASAFASVAADIDPATLVDCSPEDGVTLVAEGEPLAETVTSAPLMYPAGEFGAAGVDEPTGGAIADLHQVHVPLAFTHVDGNRGSATVTISWDTPSDLDLDILDSSGAVIADDHAFNIDTQSFTATGIISPEPCETYTVVINNSYGVGAQSVALTAEVTSAAPRVR